MTEQEMWEEYDKESFLMGAKNIYDFVFNAELSNETDEAKEFYEQAIKGLANTSNIITAVKFIIKSLDSRFRYDAEFIDKVCSQILNTDMTQFEYKEVSKIIKDYISIISKNSPFVSLLAEL